MEVVSRWGFTGSPQPFALTRQRIYSFLVPAARGALDALCDRYFTVPTHGRVRLRAQQPHVLVSFVSAQRWQSLDSDYAGMGSVPVHVATVNVPVVRVGRWGGVEWQEQAAQLIPYAFADVAWDAVVNHEIWGLARDRGWLTFPPPDSMTRANGPSA